MAEVTINNSPVHSVSQISYPYGEIDSGYSCGWHTGVDIVPYGRTDNNPLLYPVFEGKIVYVSDNPNQALGCQVQILDNLGRYWRYCHLVENSIKVVERTKCKFKYTFRKYGSDRKCYTEDIYIWNVQQLKIGIVILF